MISVKTVMAVVGLTLACGAVSIPASGHHSFGRYDMGKTSVIEGTIHKYEWSNPHSWLFVDVPTANGAAVTYGFEMQSVGEMLRRGWKKTSVQPGDKVKVAFHPVRDGTPAGLLLSATDGTGKTIGLPVGGPGAGGPPPGTNARPPDSGAR